MPHELRTGELPLYREANAKPEQHVEDPHRGSLNLDHVEVGEASAGAYQAASGPSKVLAFYRKSLKRFGIVTECTGAKQDGECSDRSRISAKPHSLEFGEGETETQGQCAPRVLDYDDSTKRTR